MKTDKYLILSAIALIGLTLGLAFHFHQLERGRIVHDHLSRLEQETERMGAVVDAKITSVKLVLLATAKHIEAAEYAGNGTALPGNLHHYLTEIAQDLQNLRRISVIDPSGIVSDEQREERRAVGMDVNDRIYFKVHKGATESEFHFGRPISSKVDGKWVIPLSVAARDETGRLLAVVTAFLDEAYFSESGVGPLPAPIDETILLHRDGTVLQAPPAFKSMLGLPSRDSSPIEAAVAKSTPVSSVSMRDPFGRVNMPGAVMKVGVWPIYALKRLDRKVMDSELAEISRQIFGAALILCLLVFAMVGVQVRHNRQRSRTETALRESEGLLRSVLDNIPLSFTLKRLDGRYIMVNEAFARTRDMRPAEFIGKRHCDVSDRTVTALANVLDDEMLQTGQPATREQEVSYGNGRKVHLIATKFPVLDDEDRISGIGTIATDITARRVVEDLNARLGRIVENATNEIYTFAADTLKFQQVNRGARENLGYPRDELQQLTAVDINPELTEADFRQLVQPLLDGDEESLRFESVHQRRDGSTYMVSVDLQLAKAEDPPLFIAMVDDVTERRATEEKLRQAQKMETVGQLTGGIAHDFNNLLGIIIGNLEFLEEQFPEDGGDERHLLDAALKAALSGAELNKQMLAFSRQQSLSPSVIDLNEYVGGMLTMLHRTLGAGIDVQSSLAKALWPTDVDPSQFESALLNLAVNARDAMDGEGSLRIETENVFLDDDYAAVQADVTPGQYVMLAVTDSGKGMPPDVVTRAFEPFFTTKDVGKGSGLGLSMVFGFAKQSGGHLTIYSEEGHGTTVRLYLPRAVRAADDIEEDAAEIPRGKGETVLVVEDDPDLRTLVVSLLGGLGYAVLEAGNGKAAVDIMETEKGISLLLTDMVLPGGMGGLEVAGEAAARLPGVRILFMSGYPRDAVARTQSMGAGFVLLEKPFRKIEFACKVREVLDGTEAQELTLLSG